MKSDVNINNRIEYLHLRPPEKLFGTKLKLMFAAFITCVKFIFKRLISGPTCKSWNFSWDLLIQIQKTVWKKLPEIGTIEFRYAVDAFASMPKGVARKINNINGVRVERFTNSNHNGNTIIYFHGGGYIFGSSATSAPFISGILEVIQPEILSVDYKLAPENKWPCPINQGLSVYLDLLGKGKNPKSIVFLGDSAGGNLCLTLLLKIKSKNIPYPAGVIAASPWVDLSNTGESFERNAPFDYVTKEVCDMASEQFVNGNDPKNPAISPTYADLCGLPKLLIQAGGSEVLVDQISDFANKAKQADVDVQYSIYKDMVHDWHILPDITKRAKSAFKEISDFIEEAANSKNF